MNFSTILGLLIGIGGILIGNAFEGGTVSTLVQSGAFLIVFGGTLGATFVANTWTDLIAGLKLLKYGFNSDNGHEAEHLVGEIMEMARLARKESILSIEKHLGRFDPYMKSVFRFVVDGVDPQTLSNVFMPEMEIEEQRMLAGAKVYSDAGGFAPTMGIIGAILGLIHVMAFITDTSQLGRGIATAFVATIYGIASANLFFLPIANKIRVKIRQQTLLKKITVDGAVAILEGVNPFLVQEKLNGYLTNIEAKS